MATEELIVGLDIGTTKVCAIIGTFNETGSLEIIGVGTTPSRGLRRGVVINIESTVKSIQNAIESAELMSGREVHGVTTGIAGGHIEGINSRGVVAVTGRDREISKEDVDRVIDAAKAIVIPMDREVLHVIPQEFIVDQQGGIKNPVGMVGVRLEAEAHIITGAVTSAQNIVKCVNRAGFKVNDIVLEPLASSKAVLTGDERELGVLLIDLGGGTTDVLVHIEGAPYHTEVLSIGGEQVTSDLSIMLKAPLEVAEKVKKEHGCCYVPAVLEDVEVTIPGVGGRPASLTEDRLVVVGFHRSRLETVGLLAGVLAKAAADANGQIHQDPHHISRRLRVPMTRRKGRLSSKQPRPRDSAQTLQKLPAIRLHYYASPRPVGTVLNPLKSLLRRSR